VGKKKRRHVWGSTKETNVGDVVLDDESPVGTPLL